MSQNNEPVFRPRVVRAFLIALGIGFGLYIGRISTLMDDWLFILFGSCVASLPIGYTAIYEVWLLWQKEARSRR
jgi:hypothetical protein